MASPAATSTARSVSVAPPLAEASDSGWYLTSGPALPLAPLDGEIRCDCLVVGAGWMGLHAARRYAELRPDASVVLVDAGRIGNNASGRCMGFAIDLAHNPRKRDFVEDVQGNRDELTTNLEGNAYLRSAVEELGVACDWDPQGKYHSAATDHGVADLVSFSKALDRMGQAYRWVERDEIRAITGSRHYIRALHHPGTILLQPALYLKNAARALPGNVAVHENTPVTGVAYGASEHVVDTAAGRIVARTLILCTAAHLTHFGFYPGSAIPVCTFASMTRELTPAELAKAGDRDAYGLIPADSFGTTVRRTRDNRLILRNVYTYGDGFVANRGDVAAARKQQQVAFERRWPELAPMGFEVSWGGLLTLAQNGGMVFGELARGVYGAAFCNGTGVSRGTAFGKAIAELAAGQRTPVIDILRRRSAPSRTIPLVTPTAVRFETRRRFRSAGREV